jgi:hypothetical protein
MDKYVCGHFYCKWKDLDLRGTKLNIINIWGNTGCCWGRNGMTLRVGRNFKTAARLRAVVVEKEEEQKFDVSIKDSVTSDGEHLG